MIALRMRWWERGRPKPNKQVYHTWKQEDKGLQWIGVGQVSVSTGCQLFLDPGFSGHHYENK